MESFITCTLDANGLDAALAAARRFSKRTPAIAVNTAAFFVMRGWVQSVKKVSVATIDAELGTLITPRIGVRGQPLSTRSSKNRILSGTRKGNVVKTVPLAVLIILARANRAGLSRGQGTGTISNYNMRTGSRYALARTYPSKAGMAAAINKMIKSRHSSTAFLASAGIPVLRGLEPHVDAKYRRGAPPKDAAAELAAKRSIEPKGEVQPALTGDTVAFCAVALMIGLVASKNSQNMNRALHQIGGPELQRQIDVEAMKTVEQVVKWEARELKENLKRMGAIA